MGYTELINYEKGVPKPTNLCLKNRYLSKHIVHTETSKYSLLKILATPLWSELWIALIRFVIRNFATTYTHHKITKWNLSCKICRLVFEYSWHKLQLAKGNNIYQVPTFNLKVKWFHFTSFLFLPTRMISKTEESISNYL